MTAAALGLVAVPALTANEGTAGDNSWLIWPLFSFTAAGVIPLGMLALRPTLVRWAPELRGMRFWRLATALYWIVACALVPVPLWFAGRPYDVPGGILFNPWPHLGVHVAFFAWCTLSLRYISLPAYWELLRSQHPDGPDNDFIGTRRDEYYRPEYWREDFRWLVGKCLGKQPKGAAPRDSWRDA